MSHDSEDGGKLQPCIPAPITSIVQIFLGATAVLIAIDSYIRFHRVGGDKNPAIREEKQKLIMSTVGAVSALLWPILWEHLVGLGVLVHHPATLVGFAWPMIMGVLDMAYAGAEGTTSGQQKDATLSSLRTDANVLVGIAFAVGTLLVATKRSRSFIEATGPLLMYALLLLIAFIMPNIQSESYLGYTVSRVQKSFFNYAMGFVITAITLNVVSGSGESLKDTLLKLCK